MEQGQQHDQVGARYRLQVDACTVLGEVGGGAAAGVDDDQAAALADAGEVRDRRRHGLGEVAPEQQDGLRAGQVGERERQARGRARASGWPLRRRCSCRSGRCSRCWRCPARPARTCPAGKPFRWSDRLRRRPPTASGPCSARRAASRSATRSSAASQLAGSSVAALRADEGSGRGGRAREAARRWSSPSGTGRPRLVGKRAALDADPGGGRGQRLGALQRAVRAVGRDVTHGRGSSDRLGGEGDCRGGRTRHTSWRPSRRRRRRTPRRRGRASRTSAWPSRTRAG